MAKINVYENGERYYSDESLSLGVHGGVITGSIDLSKATLEELQLLATDPYNDILIAEIQKRI